MSNSLELTRIKHLYDISDGFYALSRVVKDIDDLSTQLGDCFQDSDMNCRNPTFPDMLLVEFSNECIRFRQIQNDIDSRIYNFRQLFVDENE